MAVLLVSSKETKQEAARIGQNVCDWSVPSPVLQVRRQNGSLAKLRRSALFSWQKFRYTIRFYFFFLGAY
jgi:hypothetical protein